MTLPFSSDLPLTFPSTATFWDLRTSPQRVQRPSSPPGATYRYSAPAHLTSCSSSHGQFVISRASAMFSSLATPGTLPSRAANVYLRHSRFSRSGSQDRPQGTDPGAGGPYAQPTRRRSLRRRRVSQVNRPASPPHRLRRRARLALAKLAIFASFVFRGMPDIRPHRRTGDPACVLYLPMVSLSGCSCGSHRLYVRLLVLTSGAFCFTGVIRGGHYSDARLAECGLRQRPRKEQTWLPAP